MFSSVHTERKKSDIFSFRFFYSSLSVGLLFRNQIFVVLAACCVYDPVMKESIVTIVQIKIRTLGSVDRPMGQRYARIN